MRQERPDHTLQATSLVNEAYLRLIEVENATVRLAKNIRPMLPPVGSVG